MKISSELFPFDQDVFLCYIYVPPRLNLDLYEQLETHIIKYNDIGKVFVMGDVNCRTSDGLDYFVFDKYIDQNLTFMNNCEIPVRVNQDRILDYNGRYFLDLCQSTGLLIANGRLLNDQGKGKYTFCSQQGQSTVDYLLLNFTDFELLSHFDILEFNEHSDHAPISFNIRLLCEHTLENDEQECSEHEIGRKIVWDSEKVTDFQSSLLNNNAHIQQFTSDVSTEPIDDVVNTFSHFLHDQAFDTFGKTYSQKKSNHHDRTNKKWFDSTCRDARNSFKAARNSFNRNRNENNRIKFTRARTYYNRAKIKAQQRFRIQEGRRLNNLAKSEPRRFWINIKKSYKKSNVEADKLNVQDLHDHFHSLFGEQYNEHTNAEPDLNHITTKS